MIVRRWMWGGAAVGILLVWALISAPSMRFQAAPELPPARTLPMESEPSINAIRALGERLTDVELRSVQRVEAGVIEVEAVYIGTTTPMDQPAWNLRAKEIANALTQSPANTQTIRVHLYQGETLRSTAVSSRSE